MLIPCHPSGILFDIIEAVYLYLASMGLGSAPQFVISPVAEQSLGYASITAEWLCKTKQDKAFVPETPFVHSEMQQSNLLRAFPSAHHSKLAAVYREPCIIYASHPSLRLGESVYFMRHLCKNPNNLVVMTDPAVDPEWALKPYEPYSINVLPCPLDVQLSVSDASELLDSINPPHVIAPVQYTESATALQTKGSSVIHALSLFTPLHVPLSCAFQKAYASEQLAKRIKTDKTLDGVSLSHITAIASVADSRVHLDVLPDDKSRQRESQLLCGHFTHNQLVDALMKNGIDDFDIVQLQKGGASDSEWDWVISIKEKEAKVYLSQHATHIESNNEPLRAALSKVVTSCLVCL